MRKTIADGYDEDGRNIIITERDWRKDYRPGEMIPTVFFHHVLMRPEEDGHVWSCYEGEEDIIQIASGFVRSADRIGFYITEEAVPADTYITVFCSGEYEAKIEY
jgi:hypothetical protein